MFDFDELVEAEATSRKSHLVDPPKEENPAGAGPTSVQSRRRLQRRGLIRRKASTPEEENSSEGKEDPIEQAPAARRVASPQKRSLGPPEARLPPQGNSEVPKHASGLSAEGTPKEAVGPGDSQRFEPSPPPPPPQGFSGGFENLSVPGASFEEFKPSTMRTLPTPMSTTGRRKWRVGQQPLAGKISISRPGRTAIWGEEAALRSSPGSGRKSRSSLKSGSLGYGFGRGFGGGTGISNSASDEEEHDDEESHRASRSCCG